MTSTESLYAPAAAEPHSLRRIRRLSLPFEILFAGLAVLVVLFFTGLVVAGIFYEGPYLRVSPIGVWILFDLADGPADSVAVGDLALHTRLAGAVALTVIYGSAFAALLNLKRLFSQYRHGIVFAAATVSLMRRGGFWLMAFAFAPGLMQPLMRLSGGIDRSWFHWDSIAELIVGGALLVLANVIALGREIEHERKGYV